MTATLADAGKGGALLLAAALFQVTIFAPLDLFGGTADLVVVVLVAVALLRGSVFGAAGGFFVGLVLDIATFETLGLSSLLLTLAGYWIGRYAETTGRDRAHAVLASVGVVTLLYAFGALALRFMLADPVSARAVLVEALLPQLALNLLLAVPVYALCRRVLRPTERLEPAPEVRLLG